MSTTMRLEQPPAFTRRDTIRVRRSERCHCWTEFGPPRYCPDCDGTGHQWEYHRILKISATYTSPGFGLCPNTPRREWPPTGSHARPTCSPGPK